MAFTVKRDNDPFKKYWWVLLIGFGLVAAWVCLPLMESGTGSISATRGEEGLKASTQNLDSLNNPSGAPGGAMDLSMDGTGSYKKKTSDGPAMSSLYQAPPETAAPGAPVTAAVSASGENLANALRSVAKKSKDTSGWGGDKAQKGFTGPKGSFGSLSGIGGGGGSSGAFGMANANPGVSVTRGLDASGSRDSQKSASGPKGMAALQSAAANAKAAAGAKTADLAANMGGKTFDGTGAAGAISSDKGGVYGNLDASAVPDNLKGDVKGKPADTQQSKTVPKDPSKDKKDEKDEQAELKKKIMETVVMTLVSGATNAMVGSIFGTAVMQANNANAKAELCGGGSGSVSGGKATCN